MFLLFLILKGAALPIGVALYSARVYLCHDSKVSSARFQSNVMMAHLRVHALRVGDAASVTVVVALVNVVAALTILASELYAYTL